MPTTAHAVSGPIGAVRHGARHSTPATAIPGGLLDRWHRRNRQTSIPHGIRKLSESGNLDNLRRLVGESDAPFRGQLFADSDVYKMLEAVAWELGREDDATLRSFYEDSVALIERAQREDGYLDSAYQDHPARAPWSDFTHGHELYCLGHLIQAAVAAQRALGDDRLLRVARRFVDLVDRLYGGDAVEYCGHPLIESALIELARLTGDPAHLRLGEAFLRRRGSGFIGEGVYGAPYYQDDVPALEATTMRGHAVRALYLAEGITDLYLETGDEAALEAVRRQWDDLVTRRMYITGGAGSRHQDEAFGDAYELPSDRAYSETCAGIALFGWAWRMYLATGESTYLDTGEVAFYNVVLAGISEAGDAFTYSNPLQRRHEHVASRQEESSERLSWFSCACCPPNLMRTFASLEHYIAATGPNSLDIALYADAEIAYENARVRMVTAYPAAGSVRLTVTGDAPGATLRLRVPVWADPAAVRVVVDGEQVNAAAEGGWISLTGVLRDAATIELSLPLEFGRRYPHRRADALRGSVAIVRGPIVYCADQADNSPDVDAIELPDTVAIVPLDGGTDLGPLAAATMIVRPISPDAPLYGDASSTGDATTQPVTLRPYATWGNSTVDAMRVWLPTRP